MPRPRRRIAMSSICIPISVADKEAFAALCLDYNMSMSEVVRGEIDYLIKEGRDLMSQQTNPARPNLP
jgi:hypothetical protein